MENTSKMAGEEAVQLYVKDTAISHHPPLRSPAGFVCVLRPDERKTVQLALTARQFSSISADGRRTVEPGVFEISAGSRLPRRPRRSASLAGPRN